MWKIKILAVLLTISFIMKEHVNAIRYGTEAPANLGRYMVYIRIRDQMFHLRECGGTLITDRDILTAKYCLQNFRTGTVYIGYHNKVSSSTNSYIEIQMTAKNVNRLVHDEVDLGLIRLPPGSIPTSQKEILNIKTIPLSQSRYIFGENEVVRVYGWGIDVTKSFPVDSLEYMDVSVTKCNSCHGDLICTSTDSLHHKRTCVGDTGGPLIVNNSLTGEVQIGVIAWTEELKGCWYPDPSYYIPVYRYYDWIKEHSDLRLK